jgi:ABC-type nickel/cobalt efflux system permease component RcnA
MGPRRLFALGAVSLGLLLVPSLGSAHPMGNFSVSHYSSLTIGEETIELRHVLDLAEIPTFQEIQETGIVPEVGHSSVGPYLAHKGETLKEGLRVELDGHRLQLHLISREVIFPPGAGGLPTLKLGFRYRAASAGQAADGIHELRFRDDNMPERTGWKEIIAVPSNGIVFAGSSVPETDRSAALSDYPTDPLSSPPQALAARVLFTRAAAAQAIGQNAPPDRVADPSADVTRSVELQPNRQPTPRSGLTEMVAAREMGLPIVLLAAVVAVGLGALHALEPGHGKTVVAAYLVGSRGTAWHALVLGLTVTLSHTAGVYLLGGLTLYASRYVVPERLYPWLAVASGLMIAALGLILFWQRFSRARPAATHRHTHLPGEPHEHAHDPDHDLVGHHSRIAGHTHHDHLRPTRSGVSLRDLIALGISGGIVPCPAALVVLLSAVSVQRTGFGLFLIVAFSIGLASVLIAIGLLVVYARQLMAPFKGDGLFVTRWLPLTSAAVVTLLGVAIVLRALNTGIPRLWL